MLVILPDFTNRPAPSPWNFWVVSSVAPTRVPRWLGWPLIQPEGEVLGIAGLDDVIAAQLTRPVQSLCSHDDAQRQGTEMEGLLVQEVELDRSPSGPAPQTRRFRKK